jgi:DNA-binding transcriptional ArsR family regulator
MRFMKILPFPAAVPAGHRDKMADLAWQDQWRQVMAALRRFLTARVFYVINQLHMMSRIQARTDAFRAIADPTRRAILDRLRAGPANAGTLAADFQSSRPAVSRHLRVLREARLVVDTRIGRERVYAVNPVPLQSVAGWLEGYRSFWQASLTKLKRNLEAK